MTQTDNTFLQANEDEELIFTNKVRKQLVNSITNELNKMPEDMKDRVILLQALDGIDRQAISRKKIKSDEGISDKQALASETIAQLFNTRDVKKMSVSEIQGTIKQLDTNLPIANLIEGELDQNSKAIDYEQFMSK